MTRFFVQWGHLLTAMIVFAGLWFYVWMLDMKVNRLRIEIQEESKAEDS